ncbi:MAG: hypothetical protein H7145_14710, partial [Akkermansiaceae bacterium]|nr:hypothetical protein [Armatimonadota bacterium]
KEKVLAAKRAGITTVILPDRNRKDLEEDIPAELREGMTFQFAKTVDEVMAFALEKAVTVTQVKVKAGPKSEKAAANQAQVALDTPIPADIPQPTTPPAHAAGK